MTPERRIRIDRLVRAALAHDPNERAEFLREQCAGDKSLLRDVETLLTNRPASATSDVPNFDEQSAKVAKPTTAYQAYHLSRYHFYKASFPDLLKSRFWLEESVRLDPEFALAHAALAEQSVLEVITGLQKPETNFPNAKQALQRARELDANSVEIHAVAGYVSLVCDWNFAEAERILKEALKLNPHHAFANEYLGHVCMFQGRAEDAEKYLRVATEVEPLCLHHRIILVISYFLSRNYAKVVAECDSFLAMNSRFVVATGYRCLALEQLGRGAEAILEYEKMMSEPDGEIAYRWVGYAYALVGDRQNALKTVARLDAESQAHYLSPTHQAAIYAALNEKEEAYRYLDKGLAQRDPWMLWLGTDPRFDNLREDTRFRELIRKVGLNLPKQREVVTAEQWQRIDQLFHAAIELEPLERKLFLANSGIDEPLRLEVESLLSAHDDSESFIESPPGELAAEMFSREESLIAIGQQIGNYRIERHLGSGGMGAVYLASDARLNNRHVALKVLPPHFVVNPDRVRRFEREARAASALNHPNIVTIYEIGKSKTTQFIATEFVDGKTLRQLIDEHAFTLNEALKITIQVADALSEAHSAGIVHRDVKPENIMIRKDGYVKVLDFGLAKLTERSITPADLETSTLLQSNPGLVMGTVQYMSPEQARGQKVDARSDLWSLGIVLYELLTGHVPFSGETPSHVMVSLMEDELPALTNYANVPAKLERVVSKSLRKNPRDRYATARQLAKELRNFKHELERAAQSKDTLDAVPRKEVSTAVASSHRPIDTSRVGTTRKTGGEFPKGRFGKRNLVFVSIGVVLALGLSFAAFKLWQSRRVKPGLIVPFKTRELVRLTNTGKVTDAAISPDGRYVAYVAENRGKESLWIKEMATTSTNEITAPADRQYYAATFSPDNAQIFYIAKERNNTVGVLLKVPLQGGEPVKIISDVDGPVSFSPDGKQFVFVRGSSTGERALIVANSDGSNERKLAVRTGYDAFTFGGPGWSPDGQTIVSGAAYSDSTGPYLTLVSVRVSDGLVTPITNHRWKRVGRIGWLQDGSGLIFNAFDQNPRSTSQLWFVSYPSGEVQRVTSDVQDYDQVTLTSNAEFLIARQTQIISTMWIAPNNDANRARQILSQNEDDASYYFFRTRFSWTPDGRVVYTSLVDGVPNLWIASPEGTDYKQLTRNDIGNSSPHVTADGRYIVFVSDRSGFPNIWRMDHDGKNESQLTKGEDDSWAWCSSDSRWVVYHSGKQGRRNLWRVPIAGGTPEQLTDYPSSCPVMSPDGKWIAAYYRPQTKAPWMLAIIPFSGGPPVKTFNIPANVLFQSLVRWTPDGSGLAYIANIDGVSNLWTLPIDGGQPQQITHFKSDRIFWFDWSLDGQQLGVIRGTTTSDAVLIKELGKASTH